MPIANDSRFWQYADIHGGSQDLCKFSLDFMPAPIYYTGNACHSRFQVTSSVWFMTVSYQYAGL